MRIHREIEALLRAAAPPAPRAIADDDLATLPVPVARWMRWARVAGTNLPGTVRLLQEGEFRVSDARGWRPFAAEQYFSLEPPAFLWKASVSVAPLISVSGRDRWVDGDASMRMRLLGAAPIVNVSGDELSQGAMLRWLGEIIWFPQAALSPRIAWEGIDASAARATLSAGGREEEGAFVIDRAGRPEEYRAVRFNDSHQERLPFIARSERYGELAGVRMPVAGHALWRFEGRDFPYIRWRVTRVDHDVPERFTHRHAHRSSAHRDAAGHAARRRPETAP